MSDEIFDTNAEIGPEIDTVLQQQSNAEVFKSLVDLTAEDPPDLSKPHTIEDELKRLDALFGTGEFDSGSESSVPEPVKTKGERIGVSSGAPASIGTEDIDTSVPGLAKLGSAAADIAVGVISSPAAITRGVLETVADTGLLVLDLADSLSEQLLSMGVSESVVAALRDDPESRQELRASLIDFQENSESTVTGSLIREMANFSTSFLFVSGKIKAAGTALGIASKLATKTGMISSTALAGAIASFVVLDDSNAELDEILDEHPALRNPFAEFFIGSPDDTALDKRFKAALIGAGLGVGAETVFRTAKALRGANQSRILLKRAKKQAIEAERKAGLKIDAPEPQKITTAESRLSGFGNDRVFARSVPTKDINTKKAAKAIAQSEDDLAREFPELTPAELKSAAKAVPSEIEINFDAIDGEDSVKRLMQDVTDIQQAQVGKARRGIVSNVKTELQADQLDIDITDVLARKKGVALTAAETQAFRTVWVSSAKTVEALAKAARASGNDIDIFRFRKGVAVFNAINQSVLGARAEAGRALQAWNINVAGDAERAAVMAQLVADSGGQRIGRKMAENLLDALASGKSPGQINAMLERGWAAKTAGAIKESAIVGLLWRPATHVANITANSLRIALSIAEKGVAARIGRETLSENSVLIGEATAQGKATLTAIRTIFVRAVDAEELSALGPQARQAASAIGSIVRRGGKRGSFADAAEKVKAAAGTAKRAFPQSKESKALVKATQESIAQTGRKFDTRLNAISAEGFGLSADSGLGKTVETVGNIIRVPVTALTRADDLFKQVAFAGEVGGQAFRSATREGLKKGWSPGRVAQRIEELTTLPPEFIRLEAGNAALYSTFTQDAGSIAKLMLKARDTVPGMYFVLPFVRTPVNVLRYNFEFSPLAPLVGQWRQDIAAGGARQSIALARMAMGTSLTYLMSDYAWEGNIQGAASRKQGIREAMQRQGLEADTFRVGKFSIQMNRFEPIGMNLSVTGSLVQALKSHQLEEEDFGDVSKITAAISIALADGILNKTAFTGVSRLVSAMNYPDRRGARFVQQTLQSVFPASSLLRTAAQLSSPERKDIADTNDAIMAMILGLEDKLPRAITLHGEFIVRDVADVFNPFKIKEVKLSPIDSEIVSSQIDIRRIPRNTNFAGVAMDFSQFKDVFETYQVLAGKGVNIRGRNQFDTLNRLVESREYLLRSRGPNGARADAVRKVVRGFRRAAQAEIINDPRRQFQSEEFVRFRQRVKELENEARAIRVPSLGNIQ